MTDKSGAARRLIGYVPQARRFSFPYLVRDMVVFGRAKNLSFFSSPTHRDYERADEALDEVGIGALRGKSCDKLSGGQLQLVLIARALAGEPRLLIMDEPESHLDFRNQAKILKIIKRLASEKIIACIMNTHYPNSAFQVADKCLLLNGQEYVFGGTEGVLSRDNIRRCFAVDSTILSTRHQGRLVKSFVVLDDAGAVVSPVDTPG